MISLLFKFQVWFTIVWFWRDGFREILQLTVVALLRRPMRRDSVTLASGHAPPIYPSDFDLWQQTGQTEMTQEMTDSQIRTQFPNRNITDVPPNNIKWTNFDPVKEIKNLNSLTQELCQITSYTFFYPFQIRFLSWEDRVNFFLFLKIVPPLVTFSWHPRIDW